MKKIFFLLLLTVSSYGQTLQNPTYGNTTTNTLKIKTPTTVTSVNFLPAFEADGITFAKIDPINLPLSGFNNVDVAYVESNGNNATAQIGNSRKAFLTIDAALDALPSTGGVIRIGIGTFNSPTSSKIKENVAFIGSKKPKANNTVTITGTNTQPTSTVATKLINGTILNGTFDFSLKDNITIANLGVDTGSDWCTAFNSGNAADALVCSQFYNLSGGLPSQDGLHQLQINSRPRENIYINNVIALGKSPTSLGHAMLFENIQNSHIENVSTYYMNNGLVIKGMRVTLNGLDAHSHDYNGLVVKANDYAFSEDVTISNVVINSLNGHEGDGVRIVSENGIIAKRISLNNINCSYVKTGLQNNGSINDINVSGFTAYDTTLKGLIFDQSAQNVNLNNVYITSSAGDGIQLISDSGQSKSITNSQVYGGSSYGYLLTTTGTGIVNITNSSSISNALSSYVISGDNVYGDANYGTTPQVGNFRKNNINTKSISIDYGSSNTIGLGSNIVFDNGQTSGLKRQLIPQMNASNGLDFWYFNGSSYVNTGAKINATGTMSAQPATVSTELVTKGQLDAAIPAGVKRYKALISQTATNNPNIIVLENSLGATISMTRQGVGHYRTTISTGIFIGNKTFRYIQNANYGVSKQQVEMAAVITDTNIYDMYTQIDGVNTDGVLLNASYLIEIYP